MTNAAKREERRHRLCAVLCRLQQRSSRAGYDRLLVFFFFLLALPRPSERTRCDLNVDAAVHILRAVRLVLATAKVASLRRDATFFIFYCSGSRALAGCPADDIFRGDAHRLLVRERSSATDFWLVPMSAMLVCFCGGRCISILRRHWEICADNPRSITRVSSFSHAVIVLNCTLEFCFIPMFCISLFSRCSLFHWRLCANPKGKN